VANEIFKTSVVEKELCYQMTLCINAESASVFLFGGEDFQNQRGENGS
jgi:hypothetical protein